MQNQEDVCGSKADDEDAENSERQEQSPGLLAPVGNGGGAKASNDRHVTDRGNDQGHKEEDGREGGEVIGVIAFEQGLIEHVMARGDVEPRHLGGLLLEEERHHPRDGHSPDGQTGEGGPPQSAPGEGLDGVHHGQKPVNAYDCHEHDGGVHVTVKGCGDKATHFGTELPVAAGKVIADLERQHRHEEHIRRGQMQHVHHRGLLDLHLQEKHEDGHDVQREAYYKHASVDRGDKQRQPGAGQISRGMF